MSSNTQIAAEVIKRPAHDWLTEQYLPFTMYAIRSRALISDDGLKPVARRILWCMFKDGITPNADYIKAARIGGNAVAFHPHANTSIEAALARMAQPFSLRVPLIDPHGAVGFVTGDTPAAARYWEARLTKAAMELLKEIPDGAVEMGKNFDGKVDEPGELPVRWPVNIINGTEGIAVGYASKMFAHNPDEVMNAVRAVMKNPDLTVDKLLKLMPGPDLPTGGELVGVDGVKEYYSTGSGGFVVRGRYNIENLTRGKVRIIFYELPYQIPAEKVSQSIRDAQQAGKFKEIASVKDLTDMKNGMRLVIETKSGANHLAVLNALFKETPLETKFSVNGTVLIDGRPVQTTMLDLLKNFVEFRRAITLKKSSERLKKIDSRLYQLDAILAVLIDIDKAIAIIRKSDTVELARTTLAKTFKVDPAQADFILAMQLRKLTKQDSVSVKNEKSALAAEAAKLNVILSDPIALDAEVDKDLLETKKIISSKRRTIISGMTTEEFKEETKALAQAARDGEKNLPAYITRFADGRILRTETPFGYEKTAKKLPNSPIIEQFKVKTQEKVVVIGSDGIGRKIPVTYIAPDLISTAKDAGVHLPKGVKLVGISKVEAAKSDVGVALGTKDGLVKIAKTDFPNKDEFPVILLDEGDEVVDSRWLGRAITDAYFYFVSEEGNILIFEAKSIRVSGSKAGGVRGFRLKGPSDSVVAFGYIQSLKEPNLLILSRGTKTLKLTLASEIPTKNKGGQGVALHQLKPGEAKLIDAYVGTHIVGSLAELGNVINSPAVSKRAARGLDLDPQVDLGSFEVIHS